MRCEKCNEPLFFKELFCFKIAICCDKVYHYNEKSGAVKTMNKNMI